MDPPDDLPSESRTEVVAAVQAAWHVDTAAAEDILRASEPFWNTLEGYGGVDSWGGGEFRHLLPQVLALLRH